MTSWYVNPTCWPNVNLVIEPSGKLSMLSAADGATHVLLTLLFLESLTSEGSHLKQKPQTPGTHVLGIEIHGHVALELCNPCTHFAQQAWLCQSPHVK